MSSEREAYVWIWLPGAVSPMVAGLLRARGKSLVFNYGRSYLERADAIPVYEPELPLTAGEQAPLKDLPMANCLRDAAPDAWGRRVLMHERKSATDLDELAYLLHSGSDRIGALDFQASPTEYVPRTGNHASLADLMEAADRVQQGLPLGDALERALMHGTSIGGARPKVMIEADGQKYIAKFSSTTDVYNVVKAEYLAMRLASLCGVHAAKVSLREVMKRDVLLIERFDRVNTPQGWQRKAMVSALTILGLHEMHARYAGYDDLADIVRQRFTDARPTLHELFRRVVFNLLCGNTDDHARNHAAFWDGRMLTLTPAYDICPQGRTGNEASQAMRISGEQRLSKLSVCVEAAHKFQLSSAEAQDIIEGQEHAIQQHWTEVCDEAGLNPAERQGLLGRQFLNPFIFE